MIETSAKQRSIADLLGYLAERVVRFFQVLITDTAESSLVWPKPSEHLHERKPVNTSLGSSPSHPVAERGTAGTI